jgi:hypothetical protein
MIDAEPTVLKDAEDRCDPGLDDSFFPALQAQL